MNLLGSHDTDRLRSALATDKVIRSLSREEQLALEFPEEKLKIAIEKEKMCAVVQFSIPGVPSIYYGDEQGMCGVGDPFNRAPFKEERTDLHDFYAELARLRNSTAILSTGEMRVIPYSVDVLMILRYVNQSADMFGVEADNGAYLAVINRGDAPMRYECGAVRGTVQPLGWEIIRL